MASTEFLIRTAPMELGAALGATAINRLYVQINNIDATDTLFLVEQEAEPVRGNVNVHRVSPFNWFPPGDGAIRLDGGSNKCWVWTAGANGCKIRVRPWT